MAALAPLNAIMGEAELRVEGLQASVLLAAEVTVARDHVLALTGRPPVTLTRLERGARGRPRRLAAVAYEADGNRSSPPPRVRGNEGRCGIRIVSTDGTY